MISSNSPLVRPDAALGVHFTSTTDKLCDEVRKWCNSNSKTDSDYSKARDTIIDFINSPDQTKLNLGYLSISSLPDIFSEPEVYNRLKSLNLSYTDMESLPEGLDLPVLKTLDLGYSLFNKFPSDFNFPALMYLYLDKSMLTELPEDLDMQNLEKINLGETPLKKLPKNFNFPSLVEFNLADTLLNSLPDAIFDLPNNCEVILTFDNFSQTIIDLLDELEEDETYLGPTFDSEGKYETKLLNTLTLEEAFSEIFENADIIEPQIDELLETLTENETEKNKDNLKLWLIRLCFTASGKSHNNTEYFKSIVSMIKHVANDQDLKPVFYTVLETASLTCGDNVALSVLHFDIQKQLANINTSRPSKVYDFLVNTVFVMDFLENRASNLLKSTLRYSDPVEVYLGFPVKLKSEFSISINTDAMDHFKESNISQEELDSARFDLYDKLYDKDEIFDFLIEQPKWLETLSKFFPEKVEKLKEIRDEDTIDPDKCIDALKNYNEGLKDLSKKAMNIDTPFLTLILSYIHSFFIKILKAIQSFINRYILVTNSS